MKKIFAYPLRVFEGLLDRILAAIGALVFVQFPMFYAQYLQRLGGHLDEAERIVTKYTEAAVANRLTLTEYINVHLQSENNVFVSTGRVISDAVLRWQRLNEAYHALRDAAPPARLLVFLRWMEPGIVRQTWTDFTPGVPTTVEAAVYAAIGVLIVWAVYRGIKALIMLLYRKITGAGKISIPGRPAIGA